MAYSGPKALKQRKKKFPAFLLTFDVISVVMNSDAADLTSAFSNPPRLKLTSLAMLRKLQKLEILRQ